ncbi:MAG: LPS export ABC transporter permease LptF [Pseudomonadota bacterium]
MRSLDRYILSQLVWPFVFFVLVFTGVIWLSQSLRVIDTVVNNGQSARVFLEFTALLLPTVLAIVLPVACFAATLYAINRLYGDSEIVVMMAAGLSGLSMLRPVALFASGVLLVLLVITLYLMPNTKRMMQERVSEVRGDIAAAFLREGAFVSPAKRVTIYLRRMGRPGEMLGVFVHDERDPGQVTTYTAERAVLVPGTDGGAPQIVMFDGIAQSRPADVSGELSVLRFEQLSYDLEQMRGEPGERQRKPSEFFLYDQLTISGEALGPYELGDFRAEGHEALSSPLYALALPLLGAALVVSLGFRRQGFAGRILLAAGAAVALRLAGLAAKSATNAEAALWPLMYLPPLFGIALAIWMMSGRPFPAPRPAGAVEAVP